jgi:hypothetical protein
MITTCCDHMGEADKFVFCDINRPFPETCRTLCKAFVADQDPTPHREAVWAYRVTGPAQAQAEASAAEPGSGNGR